MTQPVAFPVVVRSAGTPRLVLRPFRLADAQPLHELIHANREHLSRWLNWAKESSPDIDAQRERVREWRSRTLAGHAASFALVHASTGSIIGSFGLHRRIGEGALEMGYWIDGAHAGRGLASEAAAALTRIAFERMGVRRMEIHAAPDNRASWGVARRIGYQEHALIRGCVLSEDGPVRDNVVWAMTRACFIESPAAKWPVEVECRSPRRAW